MTARACETNHDHVVLLLDDTNRRVFLKAEQWFTFEELQDLIGSLMIISDDRGPTVPELLLAKSQARRARKRDVKPILKKGAKK